MIRQSVCVSVHWECPLLDSLPGLARWFSVSVVYACLLIVIHDYTITMTRSPFA